MHTSAIRWRPCSESQTPLTRLHPRSSSLSSLHRDWLPYPHDKDLCLTSEHSPLQKCARFCAQWSTMQSCVFFIWINNHVKLIINNQKSFASPGGTSDHKACAFPVRVCRGYSSCVTCLFGSFTCPSPSFQDRLEEEGKGSRKQHWSHHSKCRRQKLVLKVSPPSSQHPAWLKSKLHLYSAELMLLVGKQLGCLNPALSIF